MPNPARVASVAVAALASVLAATGCGPSADEKASEARAACEEQIGDFVKALQDLDARLDVGIAYPEYGTKVGDISSAYARMNASDPGDHPDCRAIAAAAENAFNSYRNAATFWGECTRFSSSPGCGDREHMRSRLRADWSDAGHEVDRLTAGLARFGTGKAFENTNCPPGQTLNENGYCG